MAETPGAGPDQRADFTATHWTMVLRAKEQDSAPASEALDQLCRTYWYPLYVFVRREGLSPADAQDITQGFFHQLLSKNYLKDVDRERGRFRSFLLASIKHYLMNERKRARRLKRGGGQTLLSLDQEAAESRFCSEPRREEPPERALDRSWAATVMEKAMRNLAQEYERDENAALFSALRKFLACEAEDGEYAALADSLDMSNNAVGVAVHRLRKRYGALIRREVAHTVAHPFEVDEELRYLHSVLAER